MGYTIPQQKTFDTLESIDAGQRQFMLRVYNNMGLGLIVSGLISYLIGTNAALSAAIWGSPLAWVAMLAPLAVVLVMSFGIERLSAGTANALFYVYSALMGVSLSSIFVVYQLGSIVQVFFITAATFLSMSLYGYTTKRDLSKFGSFLIMGVFGLIIASLVNIFMQNSMFAFVISAIAVLVFTGLTAYDTQRIRDMYYYADKDQREKLAVHGALTLYLDFINIFISLLNILGNRK